MHGKDHLPCGRRASRSKPSGQRFGLATLVAQVLSGLIAEYGRAAAATQRYDELKGSGPLVSHPAGTGGIPRTIFEEFYGSRVGWRS